MKLRLITENEYEGLEDVDEFETEEGDPELITTEYDPLTIGPYTFHVTDYGYQDDRTIESTDINVEGGTCHNDSLNHLRIGELKNIAAVLAPHTGIDFESPAKFDYPIESRIHDAVWELATRQHWDRRNALMNP